jgi:lipid-A-disaccharide synthase-like uncharacterized protein
VSAVSQEFLAHPFWITLGGLGGFLFYGRFYVQWIASERKKQIVIPVAFWYMSSIGSVLVFMWSVWKQSPIGALGQCFNILIYSRNLVHIWRERGRLTPARNIAAHGLAVLFAATAVVFTALTWWREIHMNHDLDPSQAARNWFWLAVGGAGLACFFLRFLIQWLTTEFKRKSVVPTSFWYLSLVAASLQAPSYFQKGDWVNGFGQIANLFIYGRNLWFVYHAPEGAEAPVSDA